MGVEGVPKPSQSSLEGEPKLEQLREEMDERDRKSIELNDRLRKEDERYDTARKQYDDARAELSNSLAERIRLKDQLRSMPGKEGLQGLFSEGDKILLGKLDKQLSAWDLQGAAFEEAREARDK